MRKNTTLQTALVNDHIVKWLSEYAAKARAKGFVVGISGGIDSALTSTLCAQTGLNVLCAEMPIHQPESHLVRSNDHITQLMERFPNVQRTKTDLTAVFESFRSLFPQDSGAALYDHTLANSRARLRMTTLYYHAGIHGLLVAGTGNKVEDFGVGFYTKYGDGGVDISPIADLVKSEVFALAKQLQVPESILNAAPTDGLFGDDRTDEDQLGASYEELEVAMERAENKEMTENFTEREKTVFNIYKRLNNNNKHKMEPIPVCLIPNAWR